MFLAFRSLRLAHKIGLSTALFLAPLALVLYLLVQGQNKDIVFAAREVAGTQALATLSGWQIAADRALLGGAAPASGVEDLTAGSGAAFATLGLPTKGQAAGRAVRAATDAAALAKSRQGLRDLQGTVGDHSNLILDNVLDSYYLTDVVLNRLPDLLDRLTDIGGLAAAQGRSADARAEFLIGVGGLSAVLDGMDASMHSAMADNASGALTAALGPQYDSLHRGLVDLAGRLQKTTDASGTAGLLDASASFTRLANAELGKLLAARVADLRASQRLALAGTLLLFLLAVAGMMLVIRAGVTRPVGALWLATRRLARGELDAAVPVSAGRDEVAGLGRDIAAFRKRLIDQHELKLEKLETDAQRDRRYVLMGDMARAFSTEVDGQLNGLNTALAQLHQQAEAAAVLADNTSAEAATVQQLTTAADGSARAVAAAIELLAASSAEIPRAVAQSTTAARSMQQRAEQASQVVAELTAVAQETVGVIDLINRIAGQTNLLALNATIEASRAGEAGRGFAVVANEVKALARQTSRATEEIGRRVNAVHGSADRAIELMHMITSQVAAVDGSAAAIVAAVNQQGAATREIGQSVAAASGAMHEVTDRMTTLGQGAGRTRESVGEMLAAFRSMMRQADTLQQEVYRFLQASREAEDRRASDRRVAEIALQIVTADGSILGGRTLDVSESGMALACPTQLGADEAVLVRGLAEGEIKARVVNWRDGVLRLQFRRDAQAQAAVRALADWAA